MEHQWVPYRRDELLRSRRRVTSQGQGIYIFLQRLIHSFSRFAPPLTVLKEASGHVLAEAELEYSGVLELFEGHPDAPELAGLVREFDPFMSSERRRDLLREDRKRVASQVAAEIRRLQGGA